VGSTAERLRTARLMAAVSPSLLARDVDLEALILGCVVALVPGIRDNAVERGADGALDGGNDGCERVPVKGVARQRCHMSHELTAPAAVEGCRHAHLDAELVGFVRRAFSEAFNLGRMQRRELATALTLALILHPARARAAGRRPRRAPAGRQSRG
jgi:hypothetical protein